MLSTATSLHSLWQTEPVQHVTLPVARPRLPPAAKIAPYLERIDQNRWYSNNGPLVQEFEARLAEHAEADIGCVATVANATIGLALALQAQGAPAGTLCMVPAWSFAATAHAVRLAGLVPWLVDVNRSTGALDAVAARDLLRLAPGPLSAVMPVAPFGQPIDTLSWAAFQDETGLAVVIDAAAAFDSARVAAVPVVVSLHATKVLGIGEGGFVVADKPDLIKEVQKRSNFGFWNSREATAPALNGKISEYAAAIGLAAFEEWPQARGDYARVATSYREAFEGQNGVSLQAGFSERWVSSTAVVSVPDPGAASIAEALAAKSIGSRRWWGGGLHRHQAFEDCPRHETQVTDDLAASTIGLPCWPDLPSEQIQRIAAIVASLA